MKILVTGDRGYIGSVLVKILQNKGYSVVGYDSGFFETNLLENLESQYYKITKDLNSLDTDNSIL